MTPRGVARPIMQRKPSARILKWCPSMSPSRCLLTLALFGACFAMNGNASEAATPTPEMKRILDELAAKKGRPIENLAAVEARMQPTPADAVKTLSIQGAAQTTISELGGINEIEVDGAAGKLPARVYIPKRNQADEILPVVVYFHGGGFVLANRNTYDATPRSLAAKTQAIFVSVDYRKAPEHKFPAAHDDAFAAYEWVLKNAHTFQGDPKNVAVAGESAGANLALNVAIKARDTKTPLPSHQLLVYPIAGINLHTRSYIRNADAAPLNRPMMNWFMKNYVEKSEELQDPRLDLSQANFKGLRSTTVITAEIDPLRTEGKNLVRRLKNHGVKVSHKDYEGVTHEFFGMAPVLKEARFAQKYAADELKEALQKREKQNTQKQM